MTSIYCAAHGVQAGGRCPKCLPPIDESLLQPGGINRGSDDARRSATLVRFVQPRAHSHYFKDVSKLKTIDVYRVLALFAVTDPCLQHAVKKLLVAGGRGAGKDISQDVKEAVDTLARWQEMRAEEAAP